MTRPRSFRNRYTPGWSGIVPGGGRYVDGSGTGARVRAGRSPGPGRGRRRALGAAAAGLARGVPSPLSTGGGAAPVPGWAVRCRPFRTGSARAGTLRPFPTDRTTTVTETVSCEIVLGDGRPWRG